MQTEQFSCLQSKEQEGKGSVECDECVKREAGTTVGDATFQIRRCECLRKSAESYGDTQCPWSCHFIMHMCDKGHFGALHCPSVQMDYH